MYSRVVRQLHNSRNDPPKKSNTHPAPCMVITLPGTFSRLHFPSAWPMRNHQSALLSLFIFVTSSRAPSPLATIDRSALCVRVSVSVWIVLSNGVWLLKSLHCLCATASVWQTCRCRRRVSLCSCLPRFTTATFGRWNGQFHREIATNATQK